LGRVGERYILGNAQGNLGLAGFQELMEKVSGIRPVSAPTGQAFLWRSLRAIWRGKVAGTEVRSVAKVTRRPPRLTCNPAKAIAELGLPQTPLQEAFARSVAWFRENGYV